jgi:hypothetical protein
MSDQWTMTSQTTGPLTLACTMSGERETLTIEAIGAYAVSFTYGPEASVIVRGDDLLRVRAILDGQIENWQRTKA